MRRSPAATLIASLVLCLTLAPLQAAPITAADLAIEPAGSWQDLAIRRVHNYDLAAQGLRMQLTLFDTDFLRALMPALADQEDFPTDPEQIAALLNATKPHARSMLLYLAVRDRESEPTEWSPVFSITKQSFAMRLAADQHLTPFDNEVISPVGFINLLEKKPIAPSEAWRGLYLLSFKDDAELGDFMDMPGVLLEYRHPQKSLYLNISSIRKELSLDPAHPEAKNDRPLALLQTFFDAFPPK